MGECELVDENMIALSQSVPKQTLSDRPMRRWVRQGHTVIDIGANVGTYAARFAGLVGPSGYVLAVEPHPIVYQELADLSVVCPVIHPLNAALGDHDGTVALWMDATDSRRNSLWQRNVLKDLKRAVSVPMTTLDAAVASVPGDLAFIKVDTQGAEALVLKGASETLKRNGVMWFVEFWPEGLKSAESSVEDVVALFDQNGFVPVDETGTIATTWAHVLTECAKKTGHGHVDVFVLKREDIGRPW